MRRDVFLGCERQANAVDRGADHELHVVDDQGPVHGDRQGLVAPVELPTVDAVFSVTEVDAAMVREIPRRFGSA